MKTFEKLLRRCGLWSSGAVLAVQIEHERTHDELQAAVDAAWVEADRERARRAQAEDQLAGAVRERDENQKVIAFLLGQMLEAREVTV